MELTSYLIDFLRRWLPSFGGYLRHVGSYQRDMPVTVSRMFENALDYEHLPWLHSSTFADLTVIESGDWGWRAVAHLVPKSRLTRMELELRLDRDKNRWVTRTVGGLGKGTEIWTVAIPQGDQGIRVVVDFFVPKLPRFLFGFYAATYQAMYEKLYDEDESMMLIRQNEIDTKKDRRRSDNQCVDEGEMSLGSLSDLVANSVNTFEYAGERYGLVQTNGQWRAFTAVCPHGLGPLDRGLLRGGIVECPWHGYRFNVGTGECINDSNISLELPPLIVTEKDGAVFVRRRP